MKYQKLNKNWTTRQDESSLEYSLTDDILQLNFFLEPENHDHISENDKGIIEFTNVHTYCLEPCTKEEYSKGDYRFKNKHLPWGEFYELKKSGWEKDFPINGVIIDKAIKKSKLRHFILFLKDEVFECIAEDFVFSFKDTVSEVLEEKYPKGYFTYYLNMFTSQFDTPSVSNYKLFTALYIQITGKDELSKLKAELKCIKKDNDLSAYLKFINYREIEDFGMKQLQEMIKVIENHKL